jgi:hypothetical protein
MKKINQLFAFLFGIWGRVKPSRPAEAVFRIPFGELGAPAPAKSVPFTLRV